MPAGVTASRPIILVSDQPWDGAGGGAVLLRSLVENAIGNGIVWVTPCRIEQDLKSGRFGLRSGSLGQTGRFSLLDDILKNRARLADELEDLAHRVRASGIWTVMHGATVAIAARLAKSGKLPLHVTVHDDPVHATALRSKRLALLAPLISRDFGFVLRKAKSIDVVCRPMAERYERKYGVKSTILHRGLSTPPSPSPVYDLRRDGLSVGILGNTYSYQQLPVLGRAIASLASRHNVPARIIICGEGFGARLRQEMQGAIEVEVTGHIPEAESIERLRRCGLLYLNYPFGRLNRVLGETSFPTKLSTYIYASRPILLHAPEGTSLKDLPKTDGFLGAWTTLNPEDGSSAIHSMLDSPSFPTSHHESAEALRARYYDLTVHRATLNSILEELAGGR